ncbi:hypothetical protein CWI83_07860 [Pseudidiomarina taiwanensis]|uniref:Protein SlyX homolog n=2 Tax=Pseudidiomarina taiwanensis TaxID=337250 RepID=A0A432ZFT1_9GAMM|nr:hypothetical protein CWI83_07860 [Pseudidiomarina taiwanensis]
MALVCYSRTKRQRQDSGRWASQNTSFNAPLLNSNSNSGLILRVPYTTHKQWGLPMTVRSDDEILMRLANLESQFAFQEDTIDALNRVIAQQDEQLRLLERRLQLMAEKFQQLQEQNDSDPADPASEIPPHY